MSFESNVIIAWLVPSVKQYSKAKSILFSVNCELNQWGNWSTCGTSCSARNGTGDQERTRSVKRPSANGGTACPTIPAQERSCADFCPGNLTHMSVMSVIEMNYFS